MSAQHPDATRPTRLRAVSSDAGVTPKGDTQAGASVAPVPPINVAPLAVADRVGSAARHAVDGAANIAGELWTGPGRLVHSVVHGEAETMREHWAHIQSRSWVPEEMTGRPEKTLVLAGLAHHILVAYPVKALAKAMKFAGAKLDHAGDRAITLYGLIAFVIFLIVLLIHL